MATHTLNDEEYSTLINARKTAERRATELEAEIARVKLEDPANRVAPLARLARAQIEVVRFAVANLTPEVIRGWPTNALREIADLLPVLPDKQPDDLDLAITLRHFAKEADEIAVFREETRRRKIVEDSLPKAARAIADHGE